MQAPANPEALADRSLLIKIIAALALGAVNPFPTPTKKIPYKRLFSETKPNKKSEIERTRPKQATHRPEIIIVSRLYFEAYRPDKKLPSRNPHVIDPI